MYPNIKQELIYNINQHLILRSIIKQLIEELVHSQTLFIKHDVFFNFSCSRLNFVIHLVNQLVIYDIITVKVVKILYIAR